MSMTQTAGDTDVYTLDGLDFDEAKQCEHDGHPEGRHGHADGEVFYCVLSCACTERWGVVIRCKGFIDACTAVKITCDYCKQDVPEGWPWHIVISKVD